MKLTNNDIQYANTILRNDNKHKKLKAKYFIQGVSAGLLTMWRPKLQDQTIIDDKPMKKSGLPPEIGFMVGDRLELKDAINMLSVCKIAYLWSCESKKAKGIKNIKEYEQTAYTPLFFI